MGWTSYHKPPHQTVHQTLLKELTWNHLPPEERPTIVAHTANSSTHAFAIKDPNGLTTALIFLTRLNNKEHYNFSYKDMDESTGPYAVILSSKFLDLLSPTTNPYALQWRDRCRQVIAHKRFLASLKPGDTLTLPTPLKFHDSTSHQTFQAVANLNPTYKPRPKLVFRSLTNNKTYFLKPHHLEGAIRT